MVEVELGVKEILNLIRNAIESIICNSTALC